MNSVKVSSVPKMKKTATKSARGVTPVVEDRSSVSWLYCGLLFISGVAALVYQVLWVRQLSLVVGIEVYSITIAVSAFFAGLAVGSAVFGRVVDRVKSAMRLYAALEVAVALCAVATTLLLPHTAIPFVWMQEHAGVLAWVLPFVLVGYMQVERERREREAHSMRPIPREESLGRSRRASRCCRGLVCAVRRCRLPV